MDPIDVSNSKKWILKRVRIFQMWEKWPKKFHIFGKDFSVKNAEKKISEKNNFSIFFEKKYFFDFFLILFFLMENRQIK